MATAAAAKKCFRLAHCSGFDPPVSPQVGFVDQLRSAATSAPDAPEARCAAASFLNSS